ncbi:MAG: ABC transporter permease, partial [Cytophagaceae bacterium]|nr:ABC transporter permease [Gemmatimonadaceae bacterium]
GHYLDESAAAHRARGLSHADAVRAARVEVGSLTSVQQEVRGYGWERAFEAFVTDVRRAVRRARREPGFALTTVLTLALGIGGTTAIFSAVKPTLFDPLPYPDSRRIVAVREVRPDGAENAGTFGMYHELAAQNRAFRAIAVARRWQPTLGGVDRPQRFEGQRVSAAYFSVLGVLPALGRPFAATDDVQDGPAVVLISDGLWRRQFGADSSVIGRQTRLDDRPFAVLGVMPAGFEDVLAPEAEMWAPLQYGMSQGRAWGHHLRMIARLRPGVSLIQATEELNALGAAVLAELRPETYGTDVRFAAVRLQDAVTEAIRPALLAMLGAVALVLVIACVNVTNLVLARDARRHGEYALRAALGAGRHRLVRQVLAENLTLALAGGACGLLIAFVGVRSFIALTPPSLPRASAIDVDGGVFAFSLLVSTIVGLAFGAIPALRATRSQPHAALQAGTPRTVAGRRRATHVLVVAEVSLAVMLLVCSGLLLRSLSRVFAVDTGLEADGLLTMQVHAVGARFSDDSVTHRFFASALEATRQAPGVARAAMTSQLPLSGDADLYGVHFEPAFADDPGEVRGTWRYAVSPAYFAVMGIPLRQGRVLEAHDVAGAPPVALISASLAKRRLGGRDPIGLQVRIGASEPYTVVGVVGDVKQASLAIDEPDAVYVSTTQWVGADRAMSLVVRGTQDPSTLTEVVRQAVWSVDRDQPVVRVATMQSLVAASAAERRFALIVFEAFAITALLLAAAGLYGVLAGSVAERTREIGVRSALGATRGDILRLIGAQAMSVTALGVGLGVIGAAGATRAIAGLLFGVTPLDPLTYGAVLALLVAVAA